MYYDESTKRRNLLAGLAVGALLGAGLALLLAPGDGVADRARYVVRSARGLGRAGRRTRGYARDLHARIGAAVEERARADEDDGEDTDGDEAGGRPRVSGMARRRFKL